MAMTEQEMQMQIEIAKARARAKQSLEVEINANAPAVQTKEQALPAQGHYVDEVLPEGTPGFVRGAAHIAENMVNPTPLIKGVAKGVANTGIGALQTANAVGRSIGSSLGRAYDEYAPSVGLSPRDPESVKAASEQGDREQKMFQEAAFEPTTQEERVSIPAGQLAAGVAAGGGVGGALKAAAPRGLGYLAGTTGAAVTTAASVPTQEGLFITSEDGNIGFGINPEDDAATQQTKKFMNQSIDNLMMGVAGDAATVVGKKGFEVARSIVRGVKDWRSQSAIQQEAIEDVLSIYNNLGQNPTKAEKIAALEKAQKVVSEKGLDTYDFGEGVGKKTVKKDTISTLTSDLDPNDPVDRAIQTRLESLRASAKRGNAPKTAVALEQPEKVLNQGIAEAQAVRGGDTAIEQTRQNLQDRASVAASETDVPVQMAKDDLAAQQADYSGVIEKDPTFGPAIQKSKGGGIPLDINETERALKGKIVTKAGAAQEADKAVRDAAYKAVAETNAPAQMDEFGAAFEKVKDQLPPDIQQLVENADGSYGYLYNQIRPRLSDHIGQAYKNNKDASALMYLKRNIDEDQMSWLASNGDTVTMDRAKKAAEANKVYSAKWNDTIGKELRINKNNNKFSPGTLQEQGRDIVDRSISNPNKKESVDNLKNILGGDEGLVADTALAKATKDIQAGKGADFEKITSDLQQMANSFGPKEKARLEGFLTDVKTKKMSLDELEKKIPELQKVADAEKEEIFTERFPTLFKQATNGTYRPKGNGYDIFQNAMKEEQPETIKAIIKQAKKTPGDMEGLQTAWLKSTAARLDKNSKEVGKLPDQFVEYGKLLFGDGPEVDAVVALRNRADELEQSLNKPGLGGISATVNQKNLKNAITLVQTWVFGVLNPRAARIRTITNNLSEAYNSTDISHKAIDNVLADNEIIKKGIAEAIRKAKSEMSPAEWDYVRKTAGQLGLYSLREQTELNIEEKPRKASPTGPFKGQTQTGNIDLEHRPKVKNEDGSTSTVRSMSYENDKGEEVLIPTVSDEGKVMGNREAMEYWGKKGKFLGKFDNPNDADAYAEQLHKSQEKYY